MLWRKGLARRCRPSRRGAHTFPPFYPSTRQTPIDMRVFLTCDPSGNPSAIVRPGVNFGRGDRGRHARDRGQESKPGVRQSIPRGQDFLIQTHFFVRSVRWVLWLFDSPPLLPDNSTVMYEVVRHQQTSQIRMAIFLPLIFLPTLLFLPDFAHFCARYFLPTQLTQHNKVQECPGLPTAWASPTLIRYWFSNANKFMIKLKATAFWTLLKLTLWLGVFSAGLFLNQGLSAAVTFTNTPTAVSNTYTGTISLQIGGLTKAEDGGIPKVIGTKTNRLIDGANLREYRLSF